VVKASPAVTPAPDGVTIADAPLVDGHTAWGPLRRVPLAGQIEGIGPHWSIDAGPLGRHPATFATA